MHKLEAAKFTCSESSSEDSDTVGVRKCDLVVERLNQTKIPSLEYTLKLLKKYRNKEEKDKRKRNKKTTLASRPLDASKSDTRGSTSTGRKIGRPRKIKTEEEIQKETNENGQLEHNFFNKINCDLIAKNDNKVVKEQQKERKTIDIVQNDKIVGDKDRSESNVSYINKNVNEIVQPELKTTMVNKRTDQPKRRKTWDAVVHNVPMDEDKSDTSINQRLKSGIVNEIVQLNENSARKPEERSIISSNDVCLNISGTNEKSRDHLMSIFTKDKSQNKNNLLLHEANSFETENCIENIKENNLDVVFEQNETLLSHKNRVEEIENVYGPLKRNLENTSIVEISTIENGKGTSDVNKPSMESDENHALENKESSKTSSKSSITTETRIKGSPKKVIVEDIEEAQDSINERDKIRERIEMIRERRRKRKMKLLKQIKLKIGLKQAKKRGSKYNKDKTERDEKMGQNPNETRGEPQKDSIQMIVKRKNPNETRGRPRKEPIQMTVKGKNPNETRGRPRKEETKFVIVKLQNPNETRGRPQKVPIQMIVKQRNPNETRGRPRKEQIQMIAKRKNPNETRGRPRKEETKFVIVKPRNPNETRGRPRKVPIQMISKRRNPNETRGRPRKEQIQMIVKRRNPNETRGRPRKEETKFVIVKPRNPNETRGRPRKEPIQMTVKRKNPNETRGRPRKEETKFVTVKPRNPDERRGRPRKESIQMIVKPGNPNKTKDRPHKGPIQMTVKRKNPNETRGRPRKEETKFVIVKPRNPDERRGRPRKEPIQMTVKRKNPNETRGRPRKEETKFMIVKPRNPNERRGRPRKIPCSIDNKNILLKNNVDQVNLIIDKTGRRLTLGDNRINMIEVHQVEETSLVDSTLLNENKINTTGLDLLANTAERKEELYFDGYTSESFPQSKEKRSLDEMVEKSLIQKVKKRGRPRKVIDQTLVRTKSREDSVVKPVHDKDENALRINEKTCSDDAFAGRSFEEKSCSDKGFIQSSTQSRKRGRPRKKMFPYQRFVKEELQDAIDIVEPITDNNDQYEQMLSVKCEHQKSYEFCSKEDIYESMEETCPPNDFNVVRKSTRRSKANNEQLEPEVNDENKVVGRDKEKSMRSTDAGKNDNGRVCVNEKDEMSINRTQKGENKVGDTSWNELENDVRSNLLETWSSTVTGLEIVDSTKSLVVSDEENDMVSMNEDENVQAKKSIVGSVADKGQLFSESVDEGAGEEIDVWTDSPGAPSLADSVDNDDGQIEEVEVVARSCEKEKSAPSFERLVTEYKLLNLFGKIQANLTLKRIRFAAVMDALHRLHNLKKLDAAMLLKNANLVARCMQLQRYTGPKFVLSKLESMGGHNRRVFDLNAENVRQNADILMAKFQSLFHIPEGKSFYEVFMIEQIKFHSNN